MSVIDSKNNKGFTITELIVVMSLIAIISGFVYIFFSQSIINFLRLQSANITVVDRTRALNRMMQVVRGITNISDAQANSLTATTYFSPTDTVPSRVTYSYDASTKELTVKTILADGASPNYTYNIANQKTSVVLYGLQLQESLFAYYNRTGSIAVIDGSDYSSIASVNITINSVVEGNPGPTELSTTVLLRNKTGVR